MALGGLSRTARIFWDKPFLQSSPMMRFLGPSMSLWKRIGEKAF